MSVRRTVLAGGGTAAVVALLLAAKPHHIAAPTAAAQPPAATAGATPGAGSSSSSSSSSSTSPRVVDGDIEQTPFGPFQVAVHLTGKKITAVDVLQEPTDRPRDQEINSYAVPVLNQEALSAQGAKIDAVSGATYTSEGYITSLQSALDRAGL
ncbi:FMN-binding protein [Phaeacidiphilus oryzae]|uniref:FMN-binding protein n=1 Tax=Phaeacidiphilus oryzae TaxID=348818 RepID=UPI00056A1631|nr:FMN-binding protein [Phaeacidiphilus oryzae]